VQWAGVTGHAATFSEVPPCYVGAHFRRFRPSLGGRKKKKKKKRKKKKKEEEKKRKKKEEKKAAAQRQISHPGADDR